MNCNLRNFKIIFSVVLGVGLVLASFPCVIAQEWVTEEFTLEEITVTAQKREENQQKVPMAMEVISADDIKISGKNDLDEILSNIASAIIGISGDGIRVALRGMGDESGSYHGQPTSTPTVGINIDGVFSNRRDTSFALFDLERVEVLYGPQSTLYTSNSPAGIVNIVSASPNLDSYEVSGTIEYGNYETLHTEGALNVPLSETIAVRAAFSTSTHDGYLTNGGMDEDIKSARLRTLIKPNDNLSFLITGELSKNSGRFFGKVDQFINQDDSDDPWGTDDPLAAPSNRTNKKVYATINLDLGFGTISLVPSYATSGGHEEEYDLLQDVTYKSERSTKEKGVELRVSSSSDSFFTWIAGFNYYNSSDILDQITYDGGEPNGEWKDGTMDEKTKALFGNITYPITDRFRATAGYRLSWDDIDCFRHEVTTMRTDIVDYSSSYDNPDYKVGVEYDLSENSMIYADYTTSYRPQGMQSDVTSIAYPPPEELLAYTLGSKNRFLDNKLQVNATAYYYDYSNYFVKEIRDAYYGEDIENPTSEFTEKDPGSDTWGDGTMMGFDLQTSTIITSKDILNLSVSYLKTEWTELIFDYYYEWEVVGGEGDRGTVYPIEIAPLEDVSYAGKSMTHSPKITINAGYKHIFSLWNGGTLETGIDVNYKSKYQLSWSDDDYPYNYQEAFHKTDLSVAYVHPDGKWTISGYVRNLEDYADKIDFVGRGDTRIGDPRTYGAVLTVRY